MEVHFDYACFVVELNENNFLILTFYLFHSATKANAAPTPDKEEITIIEDSPASPDTPSAEAVKEAIQHEVIIIFYFYWTTCGSKH